MKEKIDRLYQSMKIALK